MRRYLIFGVISLALLLAAINASSASVAFPVITADFSTSIIMAGWVLTAYQITSTITMPLAGKISEKYGQKTMFIIHALLFTIGSILCALAPNIYLLVAARAVQAAGGGGFLPTATGIVSAVFPEARQRFIGLFTSIFPIGMIIGPNLGGWMVAEFGWRSIFWFNVPLGIALIILSRLLLNADEKEKLSRNSRTDFIGTGLLFGAIFTLMFGLTDISSGETGTPWTVVLLLLTASVVLLFLFIRRERQTLDPIIDMTLLKERQFLATNIFNFIYGVSALGVFSLTPLYAVSVYNMTVLQSGVILTPRSVGMMVASAITSFSLLKWGYRKPILTGTLLIMASLVLLSLQLPGLTIFGNQMGIFPLLVLILGLFGIGSGLISPAANNACIELMPDKVATITGLRGMFRNLGAGVGIAVGTIVINAVGDVQQAFYFILLAYAIVLLAAIPTIFIMPASPNVPASQEQAPESEAPLVKQV